MALVQKKSINDRAKRILVFGFCVSVLHYIAFTSVARPRASSIYQIMLSITLERLLKSSEWVLFFTLSGISIIFIKDCILKFYSEDSSFKISEENTIKHPTIIVCNMFKEIKDTETFIDYRLGVDYEVNDSSQKKDTIVLGDLETVANRICLKIIREDETMEPFILGGYRTIQINFNKSIPQEKLPIELTAYMTSEKNSYGILTNQWMDGEMFQFGIKQNLHKVLDIKQEKYIYLGNKCSTESFYECVVKRLVAYDFKTCPKKCNPKIFSLPRSEEYDKIPFCKDNEKPCASFETVEIFQATTTKFCPKLCHMVQYSGKKIMVYKHKQGPYTYSFRYRFTPPHTEKVYEEYLIYDIVNMVGSVGGNLGMWIGFSFTGVISNLIKMILDKIPKKRLKKVKRRLYKRKVLEATNSGMIG